MDDNPYVHSEQTEWKIRLALARACLRFADAGAFEAAVATLIQTLQGRDADGKPIDVAQRTKMVAAATILRLGSQYARGPKVVVDQRQVHLHLQDQERARELARRIAGDPELRRLADALEAGVAGDAGDGGDAPEPRRLEEGEAPPVPGGGDR